MKRVRQSAQWLVISILLLAIAACGGTGTSGGILFVDAEFDPASPSDTFSPIAEATPAVAQTYTVLNSGKLEQISVVVTQGPSADSGMIRIDVRPTDAMGVPNLDPNTAIASIDIDTTTLPATLVEEFTTIDFGALPNREVVAGEVYAIVVEFVSRMGATDVLAIAEVLGQNGDMYMPGSGYTGQSNVSFTVNTDDYFFRTFVLVDE